MFIRRKINRMRFVWILSTLTLLGIAAYVRETYPTVPPVWIIPLTSLSLIFALGFPFWAFLDWLFLTGED